MTRKDVVQNQLDVLNSVLSSVIIGGLIGAIILVAQSLGNIVLLIPLTIVVVGIGIVGNYCNSNRKKLLLELNNMD